LKPSRRKSASFEEVASVHESTLATIIDLLDPFDVSAAWTDQYAAKPVLDRLGRAGIYTRQLPMSAQTKTAIFSQLRARLYDGTLRVPAIPDLVAELRRLRTRFAAGSASVITPRAGGSHCDQAQALALAVYALRTSGGGEGRKGRGGGRGKLPTGEGGRAGAGRIDLSEAQHDAATGAGRVGGGKWSEGNR